MDPSPFGSALTWALGRARRFMGAVIVSAVALPLLGLVIGGIPGVLVAAALVGIAAVLYGAVLAPFEQRNALREIVRDVDRRNAMQLHFEERPATSPAITFGGHWVRVAVRNDGGEGRFYARARWLTKDGGEFGYPEWPVSWVHFGDEIITLGPKGDAQMRVLVVFAGGTGCPVTPTEPPDENRFAEWKHLVDDQVDVGIRVWREGADEPVELRLALSYDTAESVPHYTLSMVSVPKPLA